MLDEEEAQARTAVFLEAIGWDYPKPDDRFQFDMETLAPLPNQRPDPLKGTQELVHQINQYLTEKKRIEARKPKRSRQPQKPKLSSSNLKRI